MIRCQNAEMPFPHLSHHFFIFPRFLWLNLPKMPLQHRLQPGQIEQDENARSFSPFPLRILQHRGPCKLAGGGRVPGAAPPREGVAVPTPCLHSRPAMASSACQEMHGGHGGRQETEGIRLAVSRAKWSVYVVREARNYEMN